MTRKESREYEWTKNGDIRCYDGRTRIACPEGLAWSAENILGTVTTAPPMYWFAQRDKARLMPHAHKVLLQVPEFQQRRWRASHVSVRDREA